MLIKKLKSWFTLVEMLIVIIMVSIWIIWIFWIIWNSKLYLNKTKTEIVWINLAREWVELVQNIRDSNRIRRYWKKDECWIKSNPLDDWWDWECNDDNWINTSSFILSWIITNENQKYYALVSKSPNVLWVLEDWRMDNSDMNFSVCKSNLTSSFYECPWSDPQTDLWRYFRSIEVKWIYKKSDWSFINCSVWSQTIWSDYCWWVEGKEFRFCSKVQYLAQLNWQIEFCSILTNFLE